MTLEEINSEIAKVRKNRNKGSVTASQMRERDEKAIKDYGIPSIILMENAGIACAGEAIKLAKRPSGQIVVCSGKGNNGGDGFVAARHLHNKGFRPAVFFFQNSSEMKTDPFTNFRILEKMKIPLVDCSGEIDWNYLKQTLKNSAVIVDALFGIGLSRPVESPFKEVIELMNDSKRPILAVDIPSGLNADTGEAMDVCVRAKRTVTLGAMKKGLLVKGAKRFTGKVMVADISIPKELVSTLSGKR